MREGAAIRMKKPLRLQRQPRGSRWNLQLALGQRGGMKSVGRFGTTRHRARLVPGTIFGAQPKLPRMEKRKIGDVANKLLFENERVKVWQRDLAPGESSDFHKDTMP